MRVAAMQQSAAEPNPVVGRKQRRRSWQPTNKNSAVRPAN